MMNGNLQWNGDQGKQVVVDAGWEGIQRATVFFHQELQDTLSVPNSGVRVRRKRRTKAGAKGSSYTVYPNPSKPGEPPRLRTGWGRSHVQYWLDRANLTARVGVSVLAGYMAILELRKNRPWLLATLTRVWGQLQTLLGRGP